MNKEKYKNIMEFLLVEKFMTITVIGSVFTFALINSLKSTIVEPLFEFLFSEEVFGFMDVTIRPGESVQIPSPKRIDLRIGEFFKQFLIWFTVISCLFLLTRTKFPDHMNGNSTGAAFI